MPGSGARLVLKAAVQGLGSQREGLIPPYFDTGCLGHVPQQLMLSTAIWAFGGGWEDQFEQRCLNRFFSGVLLRIQPVGQATGSLGWHLIFGSVGAISEQSIQETPQGSRFQR